ncbi:MAG TPA: MDR family MFS transporter [Devosia sp.]|nr:MDR family MFS transporter [Devosia sp.]
MTADVVASSGSPAPLDEDSRPSRATLVVYLGAIIVMFMSALDMQIIVTALPTIAGEFDNLHLFGWVGASYLLATAAVAPFYGKLGDLFGRRSVMLSAIVLFLIGSLVCGFAWSMESLIAARVLQGIGGGGLMVSGFAVIGEIFSPRERARYQGYTSIVFTIASVMGPVAGGWLTQAVGWRWVFFINLPIGIVVLAIIALGMKPRINTVRRKIDYLGGVLLALATISIVYWGDYVLEPGGPRPVSWLLPILGIAAIIAFIMVERRAEEPILPLHLFRSHTIRMIAAMTLVAGMATVGQFFYYALFMQTLTGFGPAGVGLLFLPSTLSSTVVSLLVGRYIARTGRYKWFPVFGMLIGGLTMLATTFATATTPVWMLALLFFCFGISMGLHLQVVMTAVQAAAPLKDIGVASGIVTQSRTIGASLGLAVNGGVLTWAMTAENARIPAAIASQIGEGLTNLTPAAVAALDPATRLTVLMHYTNGFDIFLYWIAGLYAVMFVIALMVKDVVIPKRAH